MSTARLPTVNGDANNWGTVLNDYLQQALGSDGTLVTAATNPYTTLANTNLSSVTKPGLVQLTNDLGGTAVSPTVTGLQGNDIDTTTPTDGYVLTWSASSTKWQPKAPSTGGTGGSSNIDGGSASSVYGGTTAIDCGASV